MLRTSLLRHTASLATAYLDTIADRHVGATATADELRSALGGPLGQTGDTPEAIIDALALAAERGTVATQGPRYHGFVVGGSLPAATAADWLVSTWDQNAGVHVLSPLVAVVEDIAAGWLKDLAGLPADWSTGFVTGCQGANFTALATARHHVLAAAGWDVEAQGLFGAPAIDVIVSDESHYTIFNALRMLGLGAARVRRVPADGQGRMRADGLREALASSTGPCIVCAQAGNVNSGAFDPIAEIADACQSRGAWLHVDGAFGLWAAASASRKHLVRGIKRADSVATDAHKWLNVPYDCGVVFTAHPASHRGAMSMPAAYIVETAAERDPRDFVPEESRRGRAVPVYAALRSIGRQGLGDLVDRCCDLATRLADHLRADPRLEVMNDVVLNQVLVRVVGTDDHDAATRAMVDRLQKDGTCWASGTTWHGMAALRVSISNWSTTASDIDKTAHAIIRCA
jgi:glutamate/tyrosine decarboxylase-like PLP-dependent enzyme